MHPINGYSIDEIENAICQIEEIKAARVVVGPDQSIEEIHVLASPSKGPKHLSRDIEAVLMAQYRVPVNHRKISIAQLGGESPRIGTIRPKLASVRHEVCGKRAKVIVTLSHAGKEYEGMAEGLASATGRLRLVANATLKAVECITPETHEFSLEEITALSLGRDTIVVASVAVLGSGSDEILAGCAIVKDDQREAIVRAVLDAVNRRLGSLILV